MPESNLFWTVTVICLALFFDFINGFHDTANAVATTIATGALSPRKAIMIASVFNLLGALTFSGVAEVIGSGIANPVYLQSDFSIIISALAASITWNLLTWYYGIPSSSTHALVGSLGGAIISATGGFSALNFKGFKSIIQSLTISPIIAFSGGVLSMFLLSLFWKNSTDAKRYKVFRSFQVFAAIFQAFGHGTNDAQKTMGIITATLIIGGFLESFFVPFWVKLFAAIAMAAGTSVGGWRIIKTVGAKIIKICPARGFISDFNTASIVFIFTFLRLPVSTTHLVSSSVMGVGAVDGFSKVNWNIAVRIFLAWFITIPASALLSIVFCFLFRFFKLYN